VLRPWVTAAIVVVLFVAVVGIAFRQVAGPTAAQAESPPPAAPANAPGAGTSSSAPRALIFFSGEQRGYLEPCGCSKPMIGGIARRARYFSRLPAEVATLKVDNGDMVEVPDRQHELKAEALAQFYQKAGYDAVNLGEKDFMLGFGYLRYLQRLSNVPILSANVMRGENKPAFEAYTLRPVRLGAASLPVAIVGLLSQAYAKQVAQWNPDLTVAEPGAVLDKLQPELQAKAKFILLLYHGDLDDARAVVRSRPWVNLAVTAHEAEEYRAQPVTEGGTMLVNAGQKGKHIGQVEIKRTGDGAPVPELLAPVAMEETIGDDPATRDILKQYLSHVASENLLAAVPKQKSPNGQAFAGTANCLKCHAKAHQTWQKSAHAHAFRTLANVGHGSDPDCVGCHVVGLDYQAGFRTIEQTPQFKDVGCEACHKPQASHARKPAAFKVKKVGAAACGNCHVPDHSPGFEFARYWAKIKH
jgi:hypothetical protein